MKPISRLVQGIAIKVALSAKSPADKKSRIVILAREGIISKSLAHWLITVNGLRGE